MASLIDAHPGKDGSAGPVWDRANMLGLTLSIVLPLAAVLMGNGLLFALGDVENPDYAAVSWNPPGWLIGAIWCVIYPLWGAARWKTATKDDPRASRSMWVAALIVWGLFYPVVTAFVDTTGSAIANGFSLLLAIMAIIRVWPVSMAAVTMIAPSILWLIVANALGLQALEMAR